MRRLVAGVVVGAVLAYAATASAATGGYAPAATQSCLAGKNLTVAVETKVPPALKKLTPYGSLGGLVWHDGNSGIYIEFGKTPAEATALQASVIKLFGRTAGMAASVVKGNVMFYTNNLGHEVTTVEGCLR